MTDSAARSRIKRPTGRQVVQGIVGLAIAAVLLGWGLPHFAGTSWDRILDTMGAISAGTIIELMLLMLVGLWFYTFTLTGSLPGLSHSRALIVNVAGSSVGNLLPGGGAAGVAATYLMCRSWGFSRRDTSTSVIVSGVWNILARVGLPVLGVIALLFGSTALPRSVIRGGFIGAVGGVLLLALFISVIVSERAATSVGHGLSRVLRPLSSRLRKGPNISIDELIRDLRDRISTVVRTGWLPMTIGIVGFFGLYFILFWRCLAAVDVVIPFAQLFAAYAVGRLLTAVGITPGGVGVTEAGTVAVLIAWGADPTASTAGVVLFSIYTHLFEIPLGALGWLVWSVSRKQAPTDGDDGRPESESLAQ